MLGSTDMDSPPPPKTRKVNWLVVVVELAYGVCCTNQSSLKRARARDDQIGGPERARKSRGGVVLHLRHSIQPFGGRWSLVELERVQPPHRSLDLRFGSLTCELMFGGWGSTFGIWCVGSRLLGLGFGV